MMTSVTATAHSNIALVKYWGKRDVDLNLPTAGSLSLALDAFATTTTVAFDREARGDQLTLDGVEQHGDALLRVSRFLDLVRERADASSGATVSSKNNFPTASGLASSASAFAALALAASAATGQTLTDAELSVLARRGSGSAARSVFGGFVEMRQGEHSDGVDAHAETILAPDAWDVRLLVAIVGDGGQKSTSSRDGMRRTTETSPLYSGFLESVPDDLHAARSAVLARDLAALGEVAERSALAMHASALAARPAVIYWQAATVGAIHAVHHLRAQGISAYFTIDAGPHVKVLCAPEDAATVENALARVVGVSAVHVCRPGPAAQIVS